MHRNVFLCALAALASSLPILADQPIIVSICDGGDVKLSVAMVHYSQSFFFGNSYNATGWYSIQPGECEALYNSEDRDTLYFGFAFRDSNGNLRAWVTQPSREGEMFQAAAEKVCVLPGGAFNYKAETKQALRNCRDGFEVFDFSLTFSPNPGHYGRYKYTVLPDRNDRLSRVLGTEKPSAGTKARLIFGDEVRYDGTQWHYANGNAVPEDLIEKTGLPPLLPKQQYSTKQAPVAGYVKEIQDVMGSFQACTTSAAYHYRVLSSRFDMDDYGIVISMRTQTGTGSVSSREMNFTTGAALANLDFGNPRIEDREECVMVDLKCKDGAQWRCARTRAPGGILGDDVISGSWTFWVDTREQANRILNALKAIAPYYPDGKGETH